MPTSPNRIGHPSIHRLARFSSRRLKFPVAATDAQLDGRRARSEDMGIARGVATAITSVTTTWGCGSAITSKGRRLAREESNDMRRASPPTYRAGSGFSWRCRLARTSRPACARSSTGLRCAKGPDGHRTVQLVTVTNGWAIPAFDPVMEEFNRRKGGGVLAIRKRPAVLPEGLLPGVA